MAELKITITDYEEFRNFVRAVVDAMDDAPEPIRERVLKAYYDLEAARRSQKEEQDAQENQPTVAS